MYEGKVVAVAGGAGFLGTNLAKKLLSLGATIRIGLHRSEPLIEDTRVQKLYDLDLTNAESCELLCSGADYVFMCAANSSGAAVMAETPLVHLTPNVIMNALMLEASYKCCVKKFCFISSNTVYPVSNAAMAETDVDLTFFEKYFVVGWMKAFSEKMCEMYAQRIDKPMQILVVRPGNLYGPHDKFNWKESKVIAALVRRAVERIDPFEVWGDGKDVKDFLFVEDFVDALVKVFERFEGYEVLNIASGKPVTINEVLSAVLIAAEYEDANVVYNDTMPSMIPFRMIDIDKIRSVYGWYPKTSLDLGLSNTVAWYRKNPSTDKLS